MYTSDYATYVQIITWFLDDPSPLCPFSVHRMALVGKQLGVKVGQWFGPSTAAGAIKCVSAPHTRMLTDQSTELWYTLSRRLVSASTSLQTEERSMILKSSPHHIAVSARPVGTPAGSGETVPF